MNNQKNSNNQQEMNKAQSSASNAGSATSATNAGSATSATSAGSATSAINANQKGQSLNAKQQASKSEYGTLTAKEDANNDYE